MEKTAQPVKEVKQGIWPKMRTWIYEHRYYLYAFFIPAIIMTLAYGLFDVYPIGNIMGTELEGRSKPHDGSVLVLDLNGQYVYYFEALRDAIWGEESILYNWSRNLSGEYMGIIGYYLASPFTLIVMLLPRTMLLESLLIMQLAKIGSIGVTFSYYLQKSKKMRPMNSVIFSTLFALCAYAVIQLMDPMWIDGLILLPLIALGIEYLVDKKARVNYIIPLAIIFFANFYIGFMLAIFSVIYFLYYLFFGTEKESMTIKELAFTVLRFGYTSLIAGACAAVMVLPVYFSLSLGKFEFTTPDYSVQLQFDSIDILSKLLPSSYDTVRNEGLPEIYCGTLAMLMLPLFYFNDKVSSKRKLGYSLLLAVLFFSMYVKPLDMLWHGGQVPNWLPYRYSFIMSFVLLSMGAEAFEKLDGIKPNAIGGSFFGILAYLLLAEKLFKYENIEILNGLWFTAGCILCFTILVSAYKDNNTSKAIPVTIVLLVSGELLISTFDTLKDIDDDVTYSMRSSYYDYIEAGRAAVEKMEELDDGLYRSEKVTNKNPLRRTVNDNLAFGLKGLTHSSSVMNAKMIDTLGKLGYVSRGHYTRYDGTTPLTDSILGIKYVFDSENSGVSTMYPYQMSTVTEHKSGDTTQIDIYKNPYALSMGYMVDDDILNVQINNTTNPFANQNALLSAMTGQEKEYFKRLQFSQDPIYTNVTIEGAGNQTKYVANAGANDWTIDYFVHAETDDTVYVYFPTIYEKQVNLWNGTWNEELQCFEYRGQFIGNYFEHEHYCIKRLGKYEADTNFSIRMTIANEYTYMSDQLFYYFDESAFIEDITKLQENQWNIEKWSDTHIEGTVTANEGQVFFTSIPNEKGWTVKVDGKKAEITEVAGGFIGIKMEPGTHEVEMSFFPAGMPLGIVLTIAGIGLVVVFFMIDNNKKGFKFMKKEKTPAPAPASTNA
ncbi:MAG: YfhO family protein [Oscillospiraceae bacterium]|nr:YfhO family protein [Oscillospiraceae bacterium]